MGTRKRHTEEFKKEAVMVMETRGNRSVRDVAESLGVASNQLHAWRQKYGKQPQTKRGEASVEALERELAELHRENTQLHRLLREGKLVTPHEIIHAEKAHFSIKELCRATGVSRSGYYAWAKRNKASKALSDERLLVEIRAVFKRSSRRYGSPRVYNELKERGLRTSQKRVARLMRQNAMFGRKGRRFRRTTDSNHKHPIGPNLLELRALAMAVARRQPPRGLVHHTDRGSQYASGDYQQALRDHGLICSMSGKGNCYDNAVTESLFATLKAELVHRQIFFTRQQALRELGDYIEHFYNAERRHSSIGYLSPIQYELFNQPAVAA